MRPSVNGLTAAALAFAAALGVSAMGPHRASAAPISAPLSDSEPQVTILSPTPRTDFSGDKPVEISAFYQGADNNPVAAIELFVDGDKAATKTLDVPEMRGVVSFLVDASALSDGSHRIVVRATALDAEVSSARTSFIYQSMSAQTTPPLQTSPGAVPGLNTTPELSFALPTPDMKVEGIVRVHINASDPSGKDPYVSLFVDKEFKQLKNYPPYDFDWDTTTETNGYHTIEAFGYNDSQNVGQAKPIQIYVNNPGGHTELRTDLLDAPQPAPSPVKPAAQTAAVGHTVPAIPRASYAKALPTSATARRIAKPRVAMSGRSTSETHAGTALPSTWKPSSPALMAAVPATEDYPHVAGDRLLADRIDLSQLDQKMNGVAGLSSPFVAPNISAPKFKPAPAALAPARMASLPVTDYETSPANKTLHTLSGQMPNAGLASPFVSSPLAPGSIAPRPFVAGAPLSVQPQEHFAFVAAHMELLRTAATLSAGPAGNTNLAAANAAQSGAAEQVLGSPLDAQAPQRMAEVTADGSTPLLSTDIAGSRIALSSPYVNLSSEPDSHLVLRAHPEFTKPAGDPIEAMPSPISERLPATAGHAELRVASSHTDLGRLSSPFLTAPTVDRHVVMVSLGSTHTERGTVRVWTAATAKQSATKSIQELVSSLPASHVRRVDVHMFAAERTLRMRRSSIVFNSSILRLNRPLTTKGSVMFGPLRQIFEYGGGSLLWQARTGTVLAHNKTKDIALTIGQKKAIVNREAVSLAAAPYLNHSRTMVPLSFLPMAMDVNVQYDPQNGHMTITSK